MIKAEKARKVDADKLWRGLILINLFMAVLIYLPILAPLDAYIAAGPFIFVVALINLLFLVIAGQMRSAAKRHRAHWAETDPSERGKVVEFRGHKNH